MFGQIGRAVAHRFCRNNLSAYMDGQLTAPEQERVRRHLEQCEACRWELQTLQQTVGMLRRLPPVRAPRSFEIPYGALARTPLWARDWVYSSLRAATALVTVLLLVTLAGHTLTQLPALGALPSGRGMTAEEGYMREAAPQVEAPAAAPKVAAGEPAAESPQPEAMPLAQGAAPAESEVTRAAAQPSGSDSGYTEAEQPSAEEIARMTAAPPGMGGGPAPEGTPAAPPQEEIALAPASTPLAATRAADAAALEAAEAPELVGAEPSLEADLTDADAPAARTPSLLNTARERLVGYPWREGALGAGGLLLILGAATILLRGARHRWH